MIDIIVPVYNAQDDIEACIQSVQNQSIDKWNLILVDDGSTDSSPIICDSAAAVDARIRVFHKKNGGVSSARNAGLDIATSEFIMFVDADDMIEQTMCEDILKESDGIDFVVSGLKELRKEIKITYSVKRKAIYNLPKDMLSLFRHLLNKSLLNTPCAKLYRRSIIGNQRFDSSVALGEDLIFNLKYLPKCKNASLIPVCGYLYNRIGEDSATKNFRESDVDQIVRIHNEAIFFLSQYDGSNNLENEVDRTLCEAGIATLQRIFYSNLPNGQKLGAAKKLLQNQEFHKCCLNKYVFQKQYKYIQLMCKHECYMGIQIFFAIKKIIYETMVKYRCKKE